jgi:nitrogen fixation/metabolism regulation signal transduction histidine kinase
MLTSKNKIRLALIIVGGLSLLTSFVTLIYMNIMIDRIKTITQRDARLATTAKGISILVLDARREEKNFIIYLDSTYIDRTRDIIQRVETNIDTARSIAPEHAAIFDSMMVLITRYCESIERLEGIFHEDPRALTSIQQQVIRYEERLKQTIGKDRVDEDSVPSWISDLNVLVASAATKASTEKVRVLTDLRESSDILLLLAQDIASLAQSALSKHGDEGIRSGLRAQRNALTIFFITGLVMCYLIIFLPKRILKPFDKIVNALKAIGRGETGIVRPSLTKGDEFESLYMSFQEAIQNLQEYNTLKTEKIVTLRKQFDTAIAEIKEAVIVLSKDLQIITLNSAAITLFDLPGDIIGKTIRDMEVLWKIFDKHLREDIKKRIEFKGKIKRTDLKTKHFLIIPVINNRLKTTLIIIR